MSAEFKPSPLFARVERARRRRARITETHVTLAHGSGGKAMHELVEGLFLDYLRNPLLERLEDQAVFEIGSEGRSEGGSKGGSENGSESGTADLAMSRESNGKPLRLALTTDSYVVDPIFFPGGDIGRLAINGTVNDLAMSGARPLYLSAGFILEEGFPIDDLRRILASMRDAAREAGVEVVTGDTKVVQRGSADKIFINTSGVGIVERAVNISAARARPGDKVILSGTLGDHGTTIMIARGDLELETEIESDTAPLGALVAEMLDEAERMDALDEIHALRDPTRGGLATTLNEIALGSEVCIRIAEERIPVREEVKGACEILGLDPLYVANEGKLVAVVSARLAEPLLERMRRNPTGRNAAIIGEVTADPPGIVAMETGFGGTRIVDMLVGEQLPRIC